MSSCPNCKILIKNNQNTCPFCQTPLIEIEKRENENRTSFLNPPLRFDRKKLVQAFVIFSLVITLAYFIVQLFYSFHFFGLEYVVFGLLITWVMLVILIRKRRNIVKGIVYLLVFFSMVSVYFDYTDKVIDWSITFVIPILCIAAIVAMCITIWLVDLKVGDYILYIELATIVGIGPLLFLVMGWVSHSLPSILSVLISTMMFTFMLIKHRHKIKIELQKRLHV